jgi:hypothetical protein
MARVQQVSQTKKDAPKVQNQNPKSKENLAKTNPKREPSKNEILFFRIGISLIALTLLTTAIIFTIRYFMDQNEEAGIYDDYTHVTVRELGYFMRYYPETNSYGDFSEFDGYSEYSDLKALIDGQDKLYFYFYRSSNINEDITEALSNVQDLSDKPVLFVDMDNPQNDELFTNAWLTHLNLEQSRQSMFLIYDIYADDPFDLWVLTSHIIIEINKL